MSYREKHFRFAALFLLNSISLYFTLTLRERKEKETLDFVSEDVFKHDDQMCWQVYTHIKISNWILVTIFCLVHSYVSY